MRKIILNNLLKKEGKNENDIIKWAYYGYGFLNCLGECEISKLPSQVKYAKCFDIQDGVYCVDGAL